MDKVKTEAAIFLTDYASYNEGRQFEFGHWVHLDQFESYEDLTEYIAKHFAECDRKSPLFGGIREEIMITDYEEFPSQLYSECGNLQQIMEYLRIVSDSHIDESVFDAYLENNGLPSSLDELEETVACAYQGQFESKREFAEAYFEHLEIPHYLPYNCIDWNLVADQLDYTEHNGHYFVWTHTRSP